MSLSKLLRACAERGTTLRPDARERLESCLAAWERYAPVINLTADPSRDALLHHVEEGLAAISAAEHVATRGAWLDLGSGGGFPGLVVAAARPGAVILVEPRSKRAGFLELVSAQLGHVDAVIRERIEPRTWEENVIERIERRQKVQIGVVGARAVWGRDTMELLASGAGARPVIVHLRAGEPGPDRVCEVARVAVGPHAVAAWVGRAAKSEPD